MPGIGTKPGISPFIGAPALSSFPYASGVVCLGCIFLIYVILVFASSFGMVHDFVSLFKEKGKIPSMVRIKADSDAEADRVVRRRCLIRLPACP